MVLVILDGWGIAEESKGNAISLAKTPNWDKFIEKYPNTRLDASGVSVGLIDGQIGNSEAGHMNIGAGRIVKQDISRVHEAIDDGSFFNNPAFEYVHKHTMDRKSKIHLLGLLTGTHSGHAHPKHLHALIEFFRIRGVGEIYLHLFTDGRDTAQHDGLVLLRNLQKHLRDGEKIASLCGRFYLDRKKNWNITQEVYHALVMDNVFGFKKPDIYLQESYQKGITDEFIQPACLLDESGVPVGLIEDGDAVVFFNLRSDRARQLTKPFVQEDFEDKNKESFERRKVLSDIAFVTMTDFGPDLGGTLTAFPSPDVKDSLPIMLHPLRQLYMAETEKYAHMTYFLNGGYALPVAGEDRKQVITPEFKDYSLKPDMAADDLTRKVCNALSDKKYDFVAVNFANADMVGHTGNLGATILACEKIDECLGKIYSQVKKNNGTMIITGDHGNAEEVIGADNQTLTSHAGNPVPFVLLSESESIKKVKMKKRGILADVTPTILDILGIDKSEVMTGSSLIV